jgi:hypothetical protein
LSSIKCGSTFYIVQIGKILKLSKLINIVSIMAIFT